MLITILLITLGVAGRFIPHLANFTPVGAVALFGGLYLPRRWSLILPLAIMFISDIFIGFYAWPVMISVYAGFIIIGVLGLIIRRQRAFGNGGWGKFSLVAGTTLLGSVMFYLLTNWAVWAFGTLYPHNFGGLLQSYYMALPFFRNSIAGDLFYTAVLVGGYETIKVALRDSSTLFVRSE